MSSDMSGIRTAPHNDGDTVDRRMVDGLKCTARREMVLAASLLCAIGGLPILLYVFASPIESETPGPEYLLQRRFEAIVNGRLFAKEMRLHHGDAYRAVLRTLERPEIRRAGFHLDGLANEWVARRVDGGAVLVSRGADGVLGTSDDWASPVIGSQ